MSLAHLHLVLNHIPVVGVLFAIALLAVALVRRSRELTFVALVAMAVVGAFGVAAYVTGDPAGDQVENLAGVNKAAIEQHEGAAELALIAIGITGIVALAQLALWRRVSPKFAVVSLVCALVAAGLLARTANLGGAIRHSELGGAASAGGDPGSHGDHDD